jgi:hypothetical protein
MVIAEDVESEKGKGASAEDVGGLLVEERKSPEKFGLTVIHQHGAGRELRGEGERGMRTRSSYLRFTLVLCNSVSDSRRTEFIYSGSWLYVPVSRVCGRLPSSSCAA